MNLFDNWNQTKKRTHLQNTIPYFHPREVWFAKLGANIGYEQNGKGKNFLRPVVILKKFNKKIFLALPLTTANKNGKYYCQLKCNGQAACAILSQIKLIDAKRLVYKIDTIDKNKFIELKKAICKIILSNNDF